MSGHHSSFIKAFARVSPFNKRELDLSEKMRVPVKCVVNMRSTVCAVAEYSTDDKGFSIEKECEAFSLDDCFWSVPPEHAFSSSTFADQKFVYDQVGYPAL